MWHERYEKSLVAAHGRDGAAVARSFARSCRSRNASRKEPGANNDREVIRRAVAGCGGVPTALVPWVVQAYSSGTAQAVLDFAPPDARLVFSCGWHITRDGKDVYSPGFRWMLAFFT